MTCIYHKKIRTPSDFYQLFLNSITNVANLIIPSQPVQQWCQVQKNMWKWLLPVNAVIAYTKVFAMSMAKSPQVVWRNMFITIKHALLVTGRIWTLNIAITSLIQTRPLWKQMHVKQRGEHKYSSQYPI